MDLDAVLREAVQLGASDVHITIGLPPVFRIHGELRRQEHLPVVTPAMAEGVLRHLVSEELYRRFQESGDMDFAYSLAGVGRFRVNAFRQRGSVGLAMRLINTRIPSLEELELPPIVAELSRRTKGLVLVTGPTGSGKSTTLAAMVGLINQERACHIVTLEDPIEYVHRHGKSIINQREIGSDTESFGRALRAALREDPDVIMVGEMRDLETISTAITAAETGHLVLASLHTASATQTVDRIIDVFPPHQQSQVRVQLADTLEGIVAQQLLTRADRSGRVVAVEILVATPAVRNLIREGKSHQLLSVMQTGARYGMCTMEASVRELVRQGKVGAEEATRVLSGLAAYQP
ncbi:MAG: type IV pilus twitching motility protein PilT [Clostridia bacterium]|jgi:twitching motility protein PilT|nr:type IV pilus twitching motility protein PilT [Clostridia bacterium]MDH7572630.1 type IV pilus twitching motility protein PilT [Clostridia bacterium]